MKKQECIQARGASDVSRVHGLLLVCGGLLACALQAGSAQAAPAASGAVPTTAAGPAAQDPRKWRVNLLEKGREFETFLEELARKASPAATNTPHFGVDVQVRFDDDKLLASITTGASPLRLKTLAADIDAIYVPLRKLQAMALQDMAAFATAIDVTIALEGEDARAQAWVERYKALVAREFAKVTGAPVSFTVRTSQGAFAQVDALGAKVAQLEGELKETQRARDVLRQEKSSEKLGEGQRDLLIEQTRAKAGDLEKRAMDAEKDRDTLSRDLAGLREELSIYQTPLGDLKKTIRGLELPLAVLPLAVVALFLGVVFMFVAGLLSTRRNRALMQGVERLGQALQQGFQSRPGRTGNAPEGSRAWSATTHTAGTPALGTGDGGTARVETREIMTELAASPHCLLSGFELLARRGELGAVDALLHCLPSALRARALGLPEIQAARSAAAARAEASRGSIDWHAALTEAIRLQLFLDEEFGSRLLALIDVAPGAGLRQDEMDLWTAIETGEDEAVRRRLVLLPRFAALSVMERMEMPKARWLLSLLVDVEQAPTRYGDAARSQRAAGVSPALAQIATHLDSAAPRFAAHLRTERTERTEHRGAKLENLERLREQLGQETLNIGDVFALDAQTLRDVLQELGDGDLADLMHVLDADQRGLLCTLLGVVKAETITALYEQAGSSRLQAREARGRARESVKRLVARMAPLLKEEEGSAVRSSAEPSCTNVTSTQLKAS